MIKCAEINDHRFLIHRGDRIGIVGPSVACKSAFIRLLMRFWDPVSGMIRLDGVPLKEAELRSLKERIVLVEQQIFITMIIVSHRKSTLSCCTRILRIKEGTLSEE